MKVFRAPRQVSCRGIFMETIFDQKCSLDHAISINILHRTCLPIPFFLRSKRKAKSIQYLGSYAHAGYGAA